MARSNRLQRVKRGAGSLALLAFLAWLALFGWIVRASHRVDIRRADCILVLGARSLPDGAPGPSLEGRLERAYELWKAGWAPAIVCTGGRGASGTVESEVSRNWLMSRGVPGTAIFCERESHNTRQNFEFAVPILKQQGYRTCLVVTDPFHEPRSLALASQFGVQGYPAPALDGPSNRRWGSWLYYVTRETLSWIKFGLESARGVR